MGLELLLNDKQGSHSYMGLSPEQGQPEQRGERRNEMGINWPGRVRGWLNWGEELLVRGTAGKKVILKCFVRNHVRRPQERWDFFLQESGSPWVTFQEIVEYLTELLLHVLWACNCPKRYLVKFTQILERFSLHNYKSSMSSLQMNQVTKKKIENATHQKQLMLVSQCVSF